MLRKLVPATLLLLLSSAAVAWGDHIPGQPCDDCASHAHWPRINGKVEKANGQSSVFHGTRRSDELLGHHGSDRLAGRARSDVLWGDWEGGNLVFGAPGNDAISVHYGRGIVDCGRGRDIYHVAKSRKRDYKFRNCERADYRSEAQRGGGLKPLP